MVLGSQTWHRSIRKYRSLSWESSCTLKQNTNIYLLVSIWSTNIIRQKILQNSGRKQNEVLIIRWHFLKSLMMSALCYTIIFFLFEGGPLCATVQITDHHPQTICRGNLPQCWQQSLPPICHRCSEVFPYCTGAPRGSLCERLGT